MRVLLRPATFFLPTDHCRYAAFTSDKEMRIYIACGAAAGVTAAFNAPIAGVLFTQAEAQSFWTNKVKLRVFSAAIVASFVTSFLRNEMTGLMAHSSVINAFKATQDWRIIEVFPYILIGVLGGLLGAAISKINHAIEHKRTAVFEGRSQGCKVTESVLMSILCCVIIFILPLAVSCQPLEQICGAGTLLGKLGNSSAGSTLNGTLMSNVPRVAAAAGPVGVANYSSNASVAASHSHHPFWGGGTCDVKPYNPYMTFNCANHEYNPLSTLVFGGAETSLALLFGHEDTIGVGVIVIYGVVLFFLLAVVFGTAVPAGVFIPGLLIGATFGRVLGQLMNQSDVVLFNHVDPAM